MYCLHCKYTTKLRNDKEINALFALYNGVQQSLLHQQSNRAPTLQSYHRMQKTSGARYSPTDCTDVHRLGGYGIPAIPTQPQNYLPTEFTEFTEISGGGYSPTDCTDFHRSRRVWHPCHTHAALRIPSIEPIPSLFAQVLPRNSRNSQKFLAEKSLPRISQNTQKLLAEKSLPQIAQMYTDFSSPPVVSVCSVNSVGR